MPKSLKILMTDVLDETKLEKLVYEYIKNRRILNESTATRHIHRRFDISMNDSEQLLKNLSKKNLIIKYYDDEYQENRYNIKQ